MKTVCKILGLALSVVSSLAGAGSRLTATAYAEARIVVLPSVLTQAAQPLSFESDAAQEAPATISATDTGAAVLIVSGIDQHVYQVHLPKHTYVADRSDAFSAPAVRVHQFTTSSAVESVCPERLHIGATRDPIPITHRPTDYRGDFLVTIIY